MSRSVIGHLFETSRSTMDNFVFRLHYRVTVGLLLISALALLWKINYGLPISCQGYMYDSHTHPFVNDHCWYEGTYTVFTGSKRVGHDIPYPGIDRDSPDPIKKYHNAHRWVVIAVLVQAVFFYLPHMIWRRLEGRVVHQLMWNTNGSLDVVRKVLITAYFKCFSLRNLLYVGGLLLCEILNLINVVVQIFLVGNILQTSFPSLELLVQSSTIRVDMSVPSYFPLQTKCDYFGVGPTGAIQKHSLSCLMTINGVMEFIFICQWIWFLLLAILSVLALIYRLVTVFIPPFRVLRLSSEASLTSVNTVKEVVRHLRLGEYFVLYTLIKDLDPVHTKDILEGLADGKTVKEQLYPLNEIQD